MQSEIICDEEMMTERNQISIGPLAYQVSG